MRNIERKYVSRDEMVQGIHEMTSTGWAVATLSIHEGRHYSVEFENTTLCEHVVADEQAITA